MNEWVRDTDDDYAPLSYSFNKDFEQMASCHSVERYLSIYQSIPICHEWVEDEILGMMMMVELSWQKVNSFDVKLNNMEKIFRLSNDDEHSMEKKIFHLILLIYWILYHHQSSLSKHVLFSFVSTKNTQCFLFRNFSSSVSCRFLFKDATNIFLISLLPHSVVLSVSVFQNKCLHLIFYGKIEMRVVRQWKNVECTQILNQLFSLCLTRWMNSFSVHFFHLMSGFIDIKSC